MIALAGAIFLLGLLCGSEGYPGGAPRKVCRDLLPGHGRPFPGTYYRIDVEPRTYSPGKLVKVAIAGNPFTGWMLQARRAGSLDPTPVGTFLRGSLPKGSKTLGCSKDDDTVTHSDPRTKRAPLSFYWVAPAYPVGDIEFIATVAYKKDIWFSGIKSHTLQQE